MIKADKNQKLVNKGVKAYAIETQKIIFHQINIKNKSMGLTGIEKKKENGNDEGHNISDIAYDDNDDDGIIDNEAGNNGDIS